mmetsp:Transcript_4371/g.12553  ORF Transcript_4371/g.12553 Transcript_4371/m.12553 type:complete len:207 (+) Transcript_4371:443-1063(+)
MMPSVISRTSPFPVISRLFRSSATISEASSRRRYLSVLHPLASSTQDLDNWPGYSSSFPSSRSSRVKASAVAPAKPTSVAFCSSSSSLLEIVDPSPPLGKMRWILTAFGLTIMLPMLTMPSPIMQTLPFLRTHRIVVPWYVGRSFVWLVEWKERAATKASDEANDPEPDAKAAAAAADGVLASLEAAKMRLDGPRRMETFIVCVVW